MKYKDCNDEEIKLNSILHIRNYHDEQYRQSKDKSGYYLNTFTVIVLKKNNKWVARKVSIEYVKGSFIDIESIDDKLPIEEYPFEDVYKNSDKISLIGYVYY